MKQKFLPIGIFIAVAGAAVMQFTSAEANYTPHQDRVEESVGRADVAADFMRSRTMNLETGTIDPQLVQDVREQVRLHNANRKVATTVEWEEMGPDNVGGRTRAILIDKDNHDLIYAGSVSGGLWISNSQGKAWTKYDDNLPNLAVASIAQAPNGDVYFGTGADRFEGPVEGSMINTGLAGNGIFRKRAADSHFEHITGVGSIYGHEEGAWSSVYELKFLPNGTLIAATEGGLKYSEDAGATWMQAKTFDGTSLTGAAYDVQVGTDGSMATFVGSDLYVSTGSLTDFYPKGFLDPNYPQNIGTIRRGEIAIAPTNPEVMYCAISVAGGRVGQMLGVYRSVDRGDNWSIIAKPGLSELNIFNSQATYDMAIAVAPDNDNKIYVGGLDLWSWDSEENWTKLTQYSSAYYPQYNHYLHADQHTIVFHPEDPSVMYVGNDGGVFRSEDRGSTFRHMNRGYNVTQFYALGYSKHGEVIGGTQDNGTQLVNWKPELSEAGIDSGATPRAGWKVNGGDGGFAEISRINTDVMFVESQFDETANLDYWLHRTKDKGKTKQYSSTNNYKAFLTPTVKDFLSTKGSPFITPFALWENPNDLNSRDYISFVNDTTVEGVGVGESVKTEFEGDFAHEQLPARIQFSSVEFFSGDLLVKSASDANVYLETETREVEENGSMVTVIDSFNVVDTTYYAMEYDTAGIVVDSFMVSSKLRQPIDTLSKMYFTVDFGKSPTENVPVMVRYLSEFKAGDELIIPSRTLELPLAHTLEADLPLNDSVMIQDIIQSKFFISSNRGVFMTRRPLDLDGAPEWSQIAGHGSPSTWDVPTCLDYSADGNYLFFNSQSRLYRVSRLRYADTHEHADSAGVYSVLDVQMIRNFGGQTITGIDVNKKDPNMVAITLGNFGASNNSHVEVTGNALAASPVFRSIQGDLPSMPAYDVIFNVNDSSQIIVATEYGIWSANIDYTPDNTMITDEFDYVYEAGLDVNGALVLDTITIRDTVYTTHAVPNQTPTWIQENNGLGNIQCFAIKQQWYEGENKGAIYVATHGRGFFKSGTFVQRNGGALPEQPTVEAPEEALASMNVYPNPVTNILKAEFMVAEGIETASMEVYDLSAKLVRTKTAEVVEGRNEFSTDFADLPKGTYIIRVIAGAESHYSKVIKAY